MDYAADFDLDLRYGQIAEEAIRKILAEKKVEVKFDRLANKTGNLFFEIESRGKPSGLKITTADWFVVCIDSLNMMTWFKVPELKVKLARLLNEKKAITKKGGDKNSSVGILVNFQDLLQTED